MPRWAATAGAHTSRRKFDSCQIAPERVGKSSDVLIRVGIALIRAAVDGGTGHSADVLLGRLIARRESARVGSAAETERLAIEVSTLKPENLS